mmetsp:Transcript_16341/g.34342  ORF Transcript_16341/g.34342 Transcript_16341/m.34342 type:complete len:349 (-) Transcript_16341:721-1767(-)
MPQIVFVPIVRFSFQILISVGLQKCDFVVISIVRPVFLAEEASIILIFHAFVNVPNGKSTLRQHGIKPHRLTILNQEIFAFWISFLDNKSFGNLSRRTQCILSSGRDLSRCQPTQLHLGPRREHWRILPRPIPSPTSRHHIIISDSISVPSFVIQIRQTQLMPNLMSYDSNPDNVGIALVADGTGNVVLRGDLDVDFGVGVFEVARLMGPDAVFVALIVAVRSCVFGSVSRMKDSKSINRSIPVTVQSIHEGLCRQVLILLTQIFRNDTLYKQIHRLLDRLNKPLESIFSIGVILLRFGNGDPLRHIGCGIEHSIRILEKDLADRSGGGVVRMNPEVVVEIADLFLRG